MFVAISNSPRPYAWGSRTAIPSLTGREPALEPEAEVWFGAHSGSPSTIDDPLRVGGAATLADWIAADAVTTLGEGAGSRLPFLLKLLAADEPLSLQAHPTSQQAREGFARDEALGIPLDAPHRNYKDEFHKPEILVALSETFEAVCGFRAIDESRAIIRGLGDLAPTRAASIERFASTLEADDALENAVVWLSAGGADVDVLVGDVVAAAGGVGEQTRSIPVAAGVRRAAQTVLTLAEHHPADPGIVVALLLNRVTLERGEALYLPAGNIHAYLHGLGVELMAASDNVLRGGLTVKHVDVLELVRVLDFTPMAAPILKPTPLADDLEVFRPDVDDFALVRVDASARGPQSAVRVEIARPAIALCTAGEVSVTEDATGDQSTLEPGDALYITPDVSAVSVSGGELFIAMTGWRAHRAAPEREELVAEVTHDGRDDDDRRLSRPRRPACQFDQQGEQGGIDREHDHVDALESHEVEQDVGSPAHAEGHPSVEEERENRRDGI